MTAPATAAFFSPDPGIRTLLGSRHTGAFLRGTKREMASLVRGATPATGIVP